MIINRLMRFIRRFCEFSFVSEANETNAPLRPLAKPFEVVKRERDGSASDPDAFNLTLSVVGTDQFVGLRLVHVAVQDWQYDINNARMVTANGKVIKGQTLPKDIKEKLRASFGHAALKDAPAPRNG